MGYFDEDLVPSLCHRRWRPGEALPQLITPEEDAKFWRAWDAAQAHRDGLLLLMPLPLRILVRLGLLRAP